MIVSGIIGRTWLEDMARAAEDEMGVKIKPRSPTSIKSYSPLSIRLVRSKTEQSLRLAPQVKTIEKTEFPRKQASWVPLFFVVKSDKVSALE